MSAASTKSAPAHDGRALRVARAALQLEADALRTLADGLGDVFLQATQILAEIPGRIIVTGMGKSGHIARKIAATLASTGSPALFVHPAEASHGDLGMIAEGDGVLALSNSGETAELADIMAHAARLGLPLIAVTGGATSPLARAARLTLLLPPVPEACPHGLAPTTSTTLMLGLGDALALALLDHRGFTPEHYRALHPGGKLGRRLLTVADLMHQGDALPLVTEEALMSEAIVTMSEKTFGCVGVTHEGGALSGVITDGDLRRHMESGLLLRRAREVMTPAPKTISSGALAAEALGRMNRERITSLFVVDDGRPLGLIRLHDCLRAGVA